MSIIKILKDSKVTFASILMLLIYGLSLTSYAAPVQAYANENDDDYIIEQYTDLLENATSNDEKINIMKKASSMGLNNNREIKKYFTNEINNSNNTGSLQSENVERILVNPNKHPNSISINNVTVAGVSMPDFALWPTIYKQQTNTYCSAATVYTAGKYFGAAPPSQSTIMRFWQTQWGVTYPDLPLVRNYMNYHLPSRPSDYIPYIYKNQNSSQTAFNTDLKNNVINHQPMILLIKNSDGQQFWPYRTDGHFCICSGLLTWENNRYFIGDPFYFSSYVRRATANNGEHKRPWNELQAAMAKRFGSNKMAYLT